MYQESPHIPNELDFPCEEPFADYRIVGSCDGLFLSLDFKDISLWNPSIRNLKIFPFQEAMCIIVRICLWFWL